MRIGTNHGSLSDRIMNRYGDTPLGMVESALEFVRLCESESYHDIILSMKASSPFIMIAAYRLLAQRMDELGMDYPFHLGVTEAGEGEDGRVKSAIGIGSLLEDGIGDTIRVSLTEDSIHEIPVAQALVKKFNAMNGKNRHSDIAVSSEITWDPIERRRRQALQVSSGDLKIGGENPIGVALSYDPARDPGGEALEIFLQEAEADTCGDWISFQGAWDSKAFAASRDQLLARFPKLKIGVQVNEAREAEAALQEFSAVVFPVAAATQDETLRRLAAAASQQKKILELRFSSADQALERLAALGEMSSVLLSLATDRPIQEYRRLAAAMDRAGVKLPLHLIVLAQDTEEPVLAGSSALGSLLMDGIGDSVEVSGISLSESARLAFNTLQASRLRISKAEFIACPSCGRTLFDLQETTQRIKKKTAHLKGVKIAIMGCIVNGPGEMADADFGYVGGGPGKIHLYVGKECVEKNIPTAVADEKLIQLIKTHDRWIDPPSPTLSS
jgi:(E)-4-hydroxy-3-methylbut-2-enyl-diphosphate synthase